MTVIKCWHSTFVGVINTGLDLSIVFEKERKVKLVATRTVYILKEDMDSHFLMITSAQSYQRYIWVAKMMLLNESVLGPNGVRKMNVAYQNIWELPIQMMSDCIQRTQTSCRFSSKWPVVAWKLDRSIPFQIKLFHKSSKTFLVGLETVFLIIIQTVAVNLLRFWKPWCDLDKSRECFVWKCFSVALASIAMSKKGRESFEVGLKVVHVKKSKTHKSFFGLSSCTNRGTGDQKNCW